VPARSSTSVCLGAAAGGASGVIALALLISGCGGSSRPVAYVDLSSRLRPAEFPRQTRQIFRTREDLVDYLEHAMPGRRLQVPTIDFSRQEVILVAAGPRSSTGYELRILGVGSHGGRIVVTVREHTPQLGDRVKARVTYPFRLISVPQSDRDLRLKWLGRP
jgi:hypothetical protein